MPLTEDRLRLLEDRDALHQLQIDYVRYLDAGDFEAYADLFTDDGELLLGPVARATGRAEIATTMRTLLADRVGSYLHLVSNPHVVIDGDRADGEVRWTSLLRAADGTPRVDATGLHRDDYQRTPEGWRIVRRRGFVDMPTAAPS